MGLMTSAWYKARILEIEQKIYEEIDLAGVGRFENGNDQLELQSRLKALEDLKTNYEREYENALYREGKETESLNFIPRRLTGN